MAQQRRRAPVLARPRGKRSPRGESPTGRSPKAQSSGGSPPDRRPPRGQPPGRIPPRGSLPGGRPPRLYEARNAAADLERALNLLKEGPLFRKTSRRLLFDVVERSGVKQLHAPAGGPFLEQWIDDEPDMPILAIVVLEGTLIAATKTDGPRVPYPSPLPAWIEDARELEPGVHLRGELEGFHLGDLRFEPPSGRRVRLLALTTSALGDCPAVAWSLGLDALGKISSSGMESLMEKITKIQRPELIWMAKPADLDVPLEALMHIVAGQIASDLFTQPAALVTLDATPETAAWTGNRFEDADTPLDTDKIQPSELYSLVGGANQRGRVFVLNPKNPMSKPGRLDHVDFDKVIYVSDAIPDEYPAPLTQILKAGALDDSSFNSVVTTVVATGLKPPPTTFEALPISSANPSKKGPKPRVRLTRDACVVRLPGKFKAVWDQWMADGGMNYPDPFLVCAIASDAIEQGTAERWARAVTQRQVGLALSGGGASAYRIGPILEQFRAQHVPIDVFSGLSGSALVGAFYCCDGPAGFERVKRLGPLFQLTLPLALTWTWPLEAAVDLLLRNSRVEDMEARFAPVSVALPDAERPQAGVVVKGSLGAAVRTSGALPPSFAPATKNCIRYTDGGAGTVVPARVARDCGADVTIAVNAVPGPKRGNPYGFLPGGWLLHHLPMYGRMLDNYTWFAFFWEQTSSEFGREAEVFVDFEPQIFPMLEGVAFIAAEWIASAAAKQMRIRGESKTPAEVVGELKAKWQELGG